MAHRSAATRERTPGTEDAARRTPLLSALLASAGTVPVVALSLLAARTRGDVHAVATRGAIAWASGLLCFFGGVRRGLGFRQEGGPTAGEIGSALLLFFTGLGAGAVPGRRVPVGILVAGFAAATVLDVRGAETREAPRFFGRLRPLQFPLIAASLLLLLRPADRA